MNQNYNHIFASILKMGCLSGMMPIGHNDFIMFHDGSRAVTCPLKHDMNASQVSFALKSFYEREHLPSSLLTNYLNNPTVDNFDLAVDYLSNAVLNKYKHKCDLGDFDYLDDVKRVITNGANKIEQMAAKNDVDPQISAEFSNAIKNNTAVIDNLLSENRNKE